MGQAVHPCKTGCRDPELILFRPSRVSINLRCAVLPKGHVALVAEGLGRKKWHGHVAILVNEHTISAGEMAAAFASENRLATIVGTETAGRLIPGSGAKVGAGYMLVMPKAEYRTWGDQRFAGRGSQPDLCV